MTGAAISISSSASMLIRAGGAQSAAARRSDSRRRISRSAWAARVRKISARAGARAVFGGAASHRATTPSNSRRRSSGALLRARSIKSKAGSRAGDGDLSWATADKAAAPTREGTACNCDAWS